jgi:hypothetical protein
MAVTYWTKFFKNKLRNSVREAEATVIFHAGTWIADAWVNINRKWWGLVVGTTVKSKKKEIFQTKFVAAVDNCLLTKNEGAG